MGAVIGNRDEHPPVRVCGTMASCTVGMAICSHDGVKSLVCQHVMIRVPTSTAFDPRPLRSRLATGI
jgi:hypothetical protein